MDKTFLGLLDTQVDAIKNASSPKEANAAVLATVKLLLNNADCSPEILDLYYGDKFELRQLFAAYNSVGKFTCDFYDASRKYLDPSAAKGTLGTSLEQLTQKIQEMTHEFSDLQEKEQDVLLREAELRTLHERYDGLCKKIATLKETQKNVSEEVLGDLQKTEQDLQQQISDAEKEKAALIERISSAEKVLSTLQSCIVSENEAAGKIETNVFEQIASIQNDFDALCRKKEQSLTELTAELEESQAQFVRLDEQVRDVNEKLSAYKIHLGEDCAILQSMSESGIHSVEALSDEIDLQNKAAQEAMGKLDTIIKRIVVEEENARNQILGQQNKVAF